MNVLRPSRTQLRALLGSLSLLALFALPGRAYAHCDTMDGPVVLAAQHALQSGEVAHVLPWVRAQDEAQIRHVFEHTLHVRELGDEAASLADRYFFETVVRIHREGEGEPYTGLKAAGSNHSHAVQVADRAIETGSAAELRGAILHPLAAALEKRLERAASLRDFAAEDVEAGRAYVAAYVELMHLVEALEGAANGAHHDAHVKQTLLEEQGASSHAGH